MAWRIDLEKEDRRYLLQNAECKSKVRYKIRRYSRNIYVCDEAPEESDRHFFLHHSEREKPRLSSKRAEEEQREGLTFFWQR